MQAKTYTILVTITDRDVLPTAEELTVMLHSALDSSNIMIDTFDGDQVKLEWRPGESEDFERSLFVKRQHRLQREHKVRSSNY